MKKLTNKEIKDTMLSILKYIDKTCRENKIKYSLYCGSLIGAIRHKGIIPWDDDIDIVLLKKDYDKLITIIKKENSKYKFIDRNTNSSYPFPFAKLVDTSTVIKQKDLYQVDDYGIFVDIFCYNNFPNVAGKLYYKKIVFYKCLMSGFMVENIDKNDKLYFIKKTREVLAKILGKNFIYNRYDKLCNKYNNCECDRLLSNWPEYDKKLEEEIAFKKDYKKFIDVEFDGLKAMATKNYDDVLTRYFGNYMTPPPKDKQINHGFDAYWKD